MSERIYILARWIRVWHWINAALILTLLASGISLHYSRPGVGLIKFSLAREMHNVACITLCIDYLFFFFGNIISGNWWQFIPRPHGYALRAWKQFRFYMWDMFHGAPHPFPVTRDDNFNPLQQVTYWAVMYLVYPLLMITGLIYLYPTLAPDRWFGMDGLVPVAFAHYAFAFIIFMFLLIHLYLATTGHKLTDKVKMMITGWSDE